MAFPGRRPGNRAGPALLHRARLSPADGGWSGRARGVAAALGETGPGGAGRRCRRGDRQFLPVLPIGDFIGLPGMQPGRTPTPANGWSSPTCRNITPTSSAGLMMAEVVGKAYQELPPEDKEARRLLFAQLRRRGRDGFLRSALWVAARDRRARELLPLGPSRNGRQRGSSFSAGSAKTTSNGAGASSRSAVSIIRSPCLTNGTKHYDCAGISKSRSSRSGHGSGISDDKHARRLAPPLPVMPRSATLGSIVISSRPLEDKRGGGSEARGNPGRRRARL